MRLGAYAELIDSHLVPVEAWVTEHRPDCHVYRYSGGEVLGPRLIDWQEIVAELRGRMQDGFLVAVRGRWKETGSLLQVMIREEAVAPAWPRALGAVVLEQSWLGVPG